MEASPIFFCGYDLDSTECVSCPGRQHCPKRGKITGHFKDAMRTLIKPCKKQSSTCNNKFCSECCTVRENENIFLMALRRA